MTAPARLNHLEREVATVSTVIEAKALCDKVEALRVYWRQAGDREPEIQAAEIRIRAERRLGELLLAYAAAGLIRPGSPGRTRTGSIGSDAERITLVAAKIEPRLAERARRYAQMPVDAFVSRLVARRAAIARGETRVSLFLVDEDKAARRAAREAELASKVRRLPGDKFGVILDDPEWRFEVWSRETGLDRAADNHYPTSDLATIAAREVTALAAPDCAWFRWVTVPYLAHGIRSIEVDGFTYRSSWAWAKDRIGTGYWNRNKHEVLLLAVRGDVPCPAPGQQWYSLLEAPVGAHSAKPDCFLSMIEAYFPRVPKIELNRRGPPRPGWDAWGNEATVEDVACQVP